MLRSSRQLSTSPAVPVELPLPALLQVPSDIAATDETPHWRPPGTHVAVGELLVNIPSEAHAVMIAPVAGTIGAATTVRLVGGRQVHAVELRPEPQASEKVAATTSQGVDLDAAARAAERLNPLTSVDLGSWLSTLQRAGLGANRWTSPDLLAQLQAALLRPIDTLICNLLDSDPWLPLNRSIASAYPLELAAGIGLLGRLSAAANWWAMVDQNDVEPTVAGLRKAAAVVAKSLRIAPVENDYPQLDPTLLMMAITRRRLKPGRLPTSQGALIVDAATAVAIGRVVLDGTPMIRVPLVLYDQPNDAIFLLSVPPGTPVGAVLSHVGTPAAVREIFASSPLRQIAVNEEDIIGAGELALFIAPPQPVMLADPCIRCGWCVDSCPTRCRPAALLEAAQRQDTDLALQNGLEACIECGLCTYVCPSRLPLLDGIRQIRAHPNMELKP